MQQGDGKPETTAAFESWFTALSTNRALAALCWAAFMEENLSAEEKQYLEQCMPAFTYVLDAAGIAYIRNQQRGGVGICTPDHCAAGYAAQLNQRR